MTASSTAGSSVRMAVRRVAGFTLVELLVVVAILGILAGLLLPAVQTAREAGRRTACANNMRQIGLAIHHSHDHLSRFPAGWMGDSADAPGWGWASKLLPQFDEQSLHDTIDFRRPIYDPAEPEQHASVRVGVLPTFRCPSDVIGPAELPGGLFGIGIDDGHEEHADEEHDEH